MQDRYADYSQYSHLYEIENPQDDTWKWIVLILSIWGLPAFILICLCCYGGNQPQVEVDEPDLQSEEESVVEEPVISDESINEARLASVGIDQSQIRDHRTLGFFYDLTTMGISDHPVVLNTGDIVDESTAEQLVRNRSSLPRGVVTGFFQSPPLKNLLDALLDEEIKKKMSTHH